jgi:hypothetical protein
MKLYQLRLVERAEYPRKGIISDYSSDHKRSVHVINHSFRIAMSSNADSKKQKVAVVDEEDDLDDLDGWVVLLFCSKSQVSNSTMGFRCLDAISSTPKAKFKCIWAAESRFDWAKE